MAWPCVGLIVTPNLAQTGEEPRQHESSSPDATSERTARLASRGALECDHSHHRHDGHDQADYNSDSLMHVATKTRSTEPKKKKQKTAASQQKASKNK